MWAGLRENQPELLSSFEEFLHKVTGELKRTKGDYRSLQTALRKLVVKEYTNIVFFIIFVSSSNGSCNGSKNIAIIIISSNISSSSSGSGGSGSGGSGSSSSSSSKNSRSGCIDNCNMFLSIQ